VDDIIQKFIEDTRDEDGAQTFVYLPDRGVLVNLDTCTSLELIDAATAQLTAELDEARRQLAKAARVEERLLEADREYNGDGHFPYRSAHLSELLQIRRRSGGYKR